VRLAELAGPHVGLSGWDQLPTAGRARSMRLNVEEQAVAES
jgi:hypothetical protein